MVDEAFGMIFENCKSLEFIVISLQTFLISRGAQTLLYPVHLRVEME